MAAAQYHFQFFNEKDAIRFVRSVAWKMTNVAFCRYGAWVTVIDGDGNRRQDLLTISMRLQDDRTEDVKD